MTFEPSHSEVLSGYELIARLFKGSSSEVWKVREKKTGEIYAIKIIPFSPGASPVEVPETAVQLEALKSLQHENVATLKEVFTQPGKWLFIVMEYVPGESLKALIRSRRRLDYSVWVDIILQCARGLRAAYRCDLVHRDIKPSNVILTPGGVARIVDFGLARLFRASIFGTDQGLPSKKRGQNASIVGTPQYMSPEQCQGKLADHRSDIYSLGATFYHCLAGRPPFEAETPARIMQKHRSEPLIPLYLRNPDIPDELSGIVSKMMEKDMGKRYQDYDELIEVLEQAKLACLSRERGAGRHDMPERGAIVHETAETPSPTGLPQTPKTSSRPGVLFYVLAAAFLLIALWMILHLKPGKKPRTDNREMLSSLITRLLTFSPGKERGAPSLQSEEEREKLTLERMKQISEAWYGYILEKGRNPENIHSLTGEGYLNIDVSRDAWGNQFQITTSRRGSTSRMIILSPGPDGEINTDDDLKISLGEIY